jgi:anthranilate phosphoribosyltransferase
MPNDIVTRAIDAVCSGTHLTADHASAVLDEIMEGRASDVQTGAFLVALRAKGETVAELVGLARTMRRLAAAVDVGRDDLVDTAGTGGGPLTFNISTTAALVAAGAGCAVAKHGNRSSTSRSGSADLLEALGVRIDLDPPAVARCIDEVGFGFMFAPRHHVAMKHVVPVRKEIAVRTIRRGRAGSFWASRTAATRRRSPRPWWDLDASGRSWCAERTAWMRSGSGDAPGSSRSRSGARRSGSSNRRASA